MINIKFVIYYYKVYKQNHHLRPPLEKFWICKAERYKNHFLEQLELSNSLTYCFCF